MEEAVQARVRCRIPTSAGRASPLSELYENSDHDRAKAQMRIKAAGTSEDRLEVASYKVRPLVAETR